MARRGSGCHFHPWRVRQRRPLDRQGGKWRQRRRQVARGKQERIFAVPQSHGTSWLPYPDLIFSIVPVPAVLVEALKVLGDPQEASCQLPAAPDAWDEETLVGSMPGSLIQTGDGRRRGTSPLNP